EFLNKIGQTARASDRSLCREIGFSDQTLWRLADIDHAFDVPQFQLAIEGEFFNGQREVKFVSDFLMDDEANVETEGFSRVSHGNLEVAWLNLAVYDISRQVFERITFSAVIHVTETGKRTLDVPFRFAHGEFCCIAGADVIHEARHV